MTGSPLRTEAPPPKKSIRPSLLVRLLLLLHDSARGSTAIGRKEEGRTSTRQNRRRCAYALLLLARGGVVPARRTVVRIMLSACAGDLPAADSSQQQASRLGPARNIEGGRRRVKYCVGGGDARQTPPPCMRALSSSRAGANSRRDGALHLQPPPGVAALRLVGAGGASVRPVRRLVAEAARPLDSLRGCALFFHTPKKTLKSERVPEFPHSNRAHRAASSPACREAAVRTMTSGTTSLRKCQRTFSSRRAARRRRTACRLAQSPARTSSFRGDRA